MDNYTVHIVDDEEEVRRSLAFLLTATGFTVRVHDSATSFLAVAPSAVSKACLVTDLRMPDMNGVELLEKLNEMGALVPAVVITGHGDVPMAVAAMKAGAVDFIEKPFEDEVLISSITRAAERLHKIAGSGEDIAALRPRLSGLSDRERQVLHAIVAGLPNKTIAYDLDISPRTVEVHRANIMSKMRARSLPELVRMAIALGLAE
ncbi:response regulator FixJ [Borborobacter arsenicus]|uniref:response regulator FixJ n=1 Tax=Borborobacter arsenicus TaxID=1851146 RepID=UPI0014054A9E|nr:response regulator FixJ [Pseudaminobacter arsenicus]